MNVIEGLWKVLKDKVHTVTVTTKRQLTERIIEVWHHDDELCDLAHKYILAMPQRINALIKAKGGYTKY